MAQIQFVNGSHVSLSIYLSYDVASGSDIATHKKSLCNDVLNNVAYI